MDGQSHQPISSESRWAICTSFRPERTFAEGKPPWHARPHHAAALPSFPPRLIAGRGEAAKSCPAGRTYCRSFLPEPPRGAHGQNAALLLFISNRSVACRGEPRSLARQARSTWYKSAAVGWATPARDRLRYGWRRFLLVFDSCRQPQGNLPGVCEV